MIEWLKSSTRYEVGRNIIITDNDIRTSGKDGILIQSFIQFSAHNLNILIKGNVIQKSLGEGLAIKNLAITALDIVGNELSKNQYHGIYLSQVHQKSNKFKFNMLENKCLEQVSGFGCYLFDTGILI